MDQWTPTPKQQPKESDIKWILTQNKTRERKTVWKFRFVGYIYIINDKVLLFITFFFVLFEEMQRMTFSYTVFLFI